MSHKSRLIAERVSAWSGGPLDGRYVGFFDCFNRQLFYEAHEVLEDLWLSDRHGPDGAFYQGLIQLAGAFVHLQKERPQPGAALLRRARTHLKPYAPVRHELELGPVLALIEVWLARLESGREDWHLAPADAPQLVLRLPAALTGRSGDREKPKAPGTSPTGAPPAL